MNRLTQQLQPPRASGALWQAIGYSYDDLNRLVLVIDPRNLVTSYQIDGLGNQTASVSPGTRTTSNTYEDAGNLMTSTDAKNQITRY